MKLTCSRYVVDPSDNSFMALYSSIPRKSSLRFKRIFKDQVANV